MIDQKIIKFTKQYKESKIYKLLHNTSLYLELINDGILEPRNLECEVIKQFPDSTYQCKIDPVHINLDWFGYVNHHYFELITVTMEDDYWTTKSVQAWQGGKMRELAEQGIKTFIFIYFKPSNRLVAITNKEIGILLKNHNYDHIPVDACASVGVELFWEGKDILDLSPLFEEKNYECKN